MGHNLCAAMDLAAKQGGECSGYTPGCPRSLRHIQILAGHIGNNMAQMLHPSLQTLHLLLRGSLLRGKHLHGAIGSAERIAHIAGQQYPDASQLIRYSGEVDRCYPLHIRGAQCSCPLFLP